MNFVCVEATVNDAAFLADFIEKVWQQMDRKEWFAIEDESYIRGLMEQVKGLGWKIIEKEREEVVAVCFIALPGLDKDNLGYDIGLNKEELMEVALMDISAVAPEYRGNRLQQMLAEAAEKKLAELGYRRLMCTIHPDNRFSSDTMERMGYRFVKQALKYGGLLRNIYQKLL